eukprot:INCI15598.1.p1 GENE.INCI15598.1~~INCI15598.1.p1  ORF type:complete len:546 (+),score=72.89 INCI15598.1:74-1711(+)
MHVLRLHRHRNNNSDGGAVVVPASSSSSSSAGEELTPTSNDEGSALSSSSPSSALPPHTSMVNLSGGFVKWGAYSAFVQVGTPAQEVLVSLDTGSSLFAVASSDCFIVGDAASQPATCSLTLPSPHTSLGNCAATDPFNRSISSTFRTTGRVLAQCYGDGSVGFDYDIANDTVGFDGISAPMLFGLFAYQFGAFTTSSHSGIMGLGRANVTFSQGVVYPALTTLLGTTGLADKFTMCLGETTDDANPTESEAGYMVLGDYDIQSQTDFVGYTPMLPVPGKELYNIDLQTIKVYTQVGLVGGEWPVDSNTNDTWRGTIVDSGYTVLTLQSSVYSEFVSAILESGVAILFGTYSGNSLYTLSTSVHANVGFTFAGETSGTTFEVKIPVSQLFRDSTIGSVYPATGNLYTLAVQPTVTATNVLGDTFMRFMEVQFDRVNDRVGFRFASCGVVPETTTTTTTTTHGAPTTTPVATTTTAPSILPFPNDVAWVWVSAALLVVVVVLAATMTWLVVQRLKGKSRGQGAVTLGSMQSPSVLRARLVDGDAGV